MVQIHMAAALVAVVLVPVNIFSRLRGRRHQIVGAVWMVAMLVLATSGLFMSTWQVIGPFNPIHLFSLLVFWGLARSIWHLCNRNFAAHGAEVKGLYFQGLAIAGLFTFVPGRTLNQMFFDHAPIAGFGLTFVVVGVLAIWGWRRSTQLV